ncbi:DUF883 family protein [Caldimonas brevitalea]|uniref:DUF883 domain-containing protein n=1 Tax=Caldimonas brevitalea TaxID=413882 RepID=A0A0G3BCB8_9BURK|nr:DUF883 family protein [Caldimonas brevitalea]AKJ27009.1 hypothetical protein AAW51_0318 [Caldimonas brevitalea]
MPSYTYGDPSSDELNHDGVRGMADPGASAWPTKRRASALQREWAGLQADVEELVSNPRMGDAPDVKALKERLQSSLYRVSEAVADASHGIGQRVRHTASATNDYVHEEPWKVATVALIAGALIGFLASRRR